MRSISQVFLNLICNTYSEIIRPLKLNKMKSKKIPGENKLSEDMINQIPRIITLSFEMYG